MPSSSVLRRCALAVLLLCALNGLRVHGQSYVPQAVPMQQSDCGSSQLVSFGSTDSWNKTLFPDNAEGTQLGTYWSPYYQYVYTTPFTNNKFGTVLKQVSMALLDNSGLPGPVYFRIAIYLFQESERNALGFNEAVRLGQTDEITLYPSTDQIIYVNLQRDVLLDSEGDYGIGIYSNAPFFIAGGPRRSGFSAEPQNWYFTVGYNDYSAPEAIFLYDGDKSHPVAATGCLDTHSYQPPGTAIFAFCSLIETYRPLPPAPKHNPRDRYSDVAAMTNVTRYTGVIAVNVSAPVTNSYGKGFPIVFIEGEVQVTVNAGAFIYPPLGLFARQLSFRPYHPVFGGASDLLYPNATIPIDSNGIVVSTSRNQTRLFMTNKEPNSTIGQQGQNGIITPTYFSSFIVFPAEYLEDVITSCNVPKGYAYVPDTLTCPSGRVLVQLGDTNPMDLDPLEEDEIYDFLPANLMSFRFFTVYTKDTIAYQLSYYTYANPEAIVHMRLAILATNVSYVDSFSAEPIYYLLGMTNEIELVNVDDTLVTANLQTPITLKQYQTYVIGVWVDALIYGPSARWGVDATGLPLQYNSVDNYGSFPAVVYSIGGQTGTQPMGVNSCVLGSLTSFNLCMTFSGYVMIQGQWYLNTRWYNGVVTAMAQQAVNDWGTYYILTGGNGTFAEAWVPVPGPPSGTSNIDFDPKLEPWMERMFAAGNGAALYVPEINGTWNLNNFQVQSPDYLYTVSNMQPGLQLDMQGIQVVVNVATDWDNVVFATIIASYRPRGSPTWYYQESREYDYYDSYMPLYSSVSLIRVTPRSSDPPLCPIDYTPWNLIFPQNAPFVVACTGLGNIQSTYGDNRVLDYAHDREGNLIQDHVVYTANFTATKGANLTQVSIDLLNNTQWGPHWLTIELGVYTQSGQLLSRTNPIHMLEIIDQMLVANLVWQLTPGDTLPYDGMYYTALIVDQPIYVATAADTQRSPCMKVTSSELPSQFKQTDMCNSPPIVTYGCVQATHYLCASFQYYQGAGYFPMTMDYLYQGLLKVDTKTSWPNAYGTYSPVQYGVGHLSINIRIALYPNNFHIGSTDILLAWPGNQTTNYIYTTSVNGQPLDDVGLAFLTSDDYGYELDLSFNTTAGKFQDSTNAQEGAELLQTLVIQPIDFVNVGIPQCSWLDLPPVVWPNSSLWNNTHCSANSQPVRWGDSYADDEFYNNEGLWSNAFYLITLSPFNTGPDYSLITQLGLGILQNANVFAHIRMALYDNNHTFMAESNEISLANVRDDLLYFTLTVPQLLQPASVYYAAYWADVSLYTPAGPYPNALCYYGLTYGFDDGPWPVTVDSEEAEYYDCNALPVSALGCTTTGSPPDVPPLCPPQEKVGLSTAGAVGLAVVVALVSIICTLVAQRMYTTGRWKCPGKSSDIHDDDALNTASNGSSNRYSALAD